MTHEREAPPVRIEYLYKFYGDFRAVDGLTFDVPAGSVFGFLGPNGSGKTTTLSILAGFAQPSGGRASLFGEPMVGAAGRRARAAAGFLIERPAFYDYLPGRDNLRMLNKLSAAPVSNERIDETLERAGLRDAERKKVGAYSQGMRMRLGLAQALMHRPRLLVLDEPTNGLDPEGDAELWRLLTGLARDEGVTVLISSHLLHEVERHCTHALLIREGKKVVEGTVEDLLAMQDRRLVVRFADAPTAAAARATLDSHDWVQSAEPTDDGPPVGAGAEGEPFRALRVDIGKEPVERLSQTLGQNNHWPVELRHERKTLKDLFFELTESSHH